MSFSTALSGLNAASTSLQVLGNNIANSQTTGFKQSVAQFADVYSSSLGGVTKTQPGSGVQVIDVAQQFKSGTITPTSSSLDLAINGNGFFAMAKTVNLPSATDPNAAVSPSVPSSYTRAGSFQVNNTGQVVNSQGDYLLAFAPNGATAAAGFSVGVFRPLTIDTSQGLPSATGNVNMKLNINGAATVPITVPFNPTDSTSFNNTTSVTTYDTQGNAHIVSTYYVKTPVANSWDAYVFLDGYGVTSGGPASALGVVPPSTVSKNLNGPGLPIPMTFSASGQLDKVGNLAAAAISAGVVTAANAAVTSTVAANTQMGNLVTIYNSVALISPPAQVARDAATSTALTNTEAGNLSTVSAAAVSAAFGAAATATAAANANPASAPAAAAAATATTAAVDAANAASAAATAAAANAVIADTNAGLLSAAAATANLSPAITTLAATYAAAAAKANIAAADYATATNVGGYTGISATDTATATTEAGLATAAAAAAVTAQSALNNFNTAVSSFTTNASQAASVTAKAASTSTATFAIATSVVNTISAAATAALAVTANSGAVNASALAATAASLAAKVTDIASAALAAAATSAAKDAASTAQAAASAYKDAVAAAAFGETTSTSEPFGAISLSSINPNAIVAPMAFNLNFAGTTQFATPFSVNGLTQDGLAAGNLTGISVDATGVVSATYSNGGTKPLGQVAMARFQNNQGLAKIGGTSWAQSSNSGTPIYGAAGDNNFGGIQSSALESSNVDLSSQLVNLIVAQQAYQASAQTITTQKTLVETILRA